MQISYPQVDIGHHSIEGNAAIGIPLFRPCRGGSFWEPIVLGSRRPWPEKLLPVFGWHWWKTRDNHWNLFLICPTCPNFFQFFWCFADGFLWTGQVFQSCVVWAWGILSIVAGLSHVMAISGLCAGVIQLLCKSTSVIIHLEGLAQLLYLWNSCLSLGICNFQHPKKNPGERIGRRSWATTKNRCPLHVLATAKSCSQISELQRMEGPCKDSKLFSTLELLLILVVWPGLAFACLHKPIKPDFHLARIFFNAEPCVMRCLSAWPLFAAHQMTWAIWVCPSGAWSKLMMIPPSCWRWLREKTCSESVCVKNCEQSIEIPKSDGKWVCTLNKKLLDLKEPPRPYTLNIPRVIARWGVRRIQLEHRCPNMG